MVVCPLASWSRLDSCRPLPNVSMGRIKDAMPASREQQKYIDTVKYTDDLSNTWKQNTKTENLKESDFFWKIK